MSILFVLLPLALLLGFGFLIGFLQMVTHGQYDELDTPAHRMLLDDDFTETPKSLINRGPS